MVESSDKMWSPGEGNGRPLQYSCLENPMNSMKRQKDRKLAVILEPRKIKSDTVSPSIYHEVMGPDATILVF